MRNILEKLRAERVIGFAYGFYCGILGIGHGILEILQGNIKPTSLIIDANGHQTDLIFKGSEPAMTIIPNFLITGIFAIIVSILIILCTSVFIRKKKCWIATMLLSIILLFVGGGFTPIPFGLLAGISFLGLHSDAKWMEMFFSNNIWKWIGRLWTIFFLISVIWYLQLENICSILNLSTTELGASGLLICLFAVLTGIIYDTNKKVIPD